MNFHGGKWSPPLNILKVLQGNPIIKQYDEFLFQKESVDPKLLKFLSTFFVVRSLKAGSPD